MKRLLIIFLASTGFFLHAQDIHFTNFQLAPMSLNPALTGNFHGTIRANGIFRDQNSGGYNTLSGGLEYNIPFALRKQDWISVGIEYVQDKERVVDGINAIKLNQTNIALAYHFAFDKAYRNVATAAIQYKTMSSKFDKTGWITPSDLDGTGASPTITNLAQQTPDSKGKSLTDWVGALSWHSKFGERNHFKVGFSFAHILNIDKAITASSAKSKIDPIPTRITGFASGEFYLNQIISLEPVLYFQNQSPFTEIALQTLVGIDINEQKNIKINPGLGYRFGDAVEFLFVMDYGKFKACVSFDLTSSKYKSSLGVQNGLEFGLSYTTTIIKKPKVKPVIFCPRL